MCTGSYFCLGCAMRGGGIHYPANKFSNSPFLFSLHLARRVRARDKQKTKKRTRRSLSPIRVLFLYTCSPIRAQRSPKELAGKAVLGNELCPSFLCKLVITNKEAIASSKQSKNRPGVQFDNTLTQSHKMVTRLPPPSLGSRNSSLTYNNGDCIENVT